jgi:hypothetical protein
MEQTTTTASNKQQYSTDVKRAAADADYPIEKTAKAIRALNRRIELVGGDVERALTEDRWWKNGSAAATHERMFCAVYILNNCEYPCEEDAIRSIIAILRGSCTCCNFPKLGKIASN